MIRDLRYSFRAVLVPDQSLVCFPRLLSPLPPTSNDHHKHISEVKTHEDQGLPQKEFAVPKDGDDQTGGNEEESDIPQERVPLHLEGLNDAHRTHHTAHDERSGPEELPNRQTAGFAPHGGEGREQIGATVSEREEGYSGNAFVQPEGLSDRGEVRAEEVGGTYADCREEEYEPDGEAGKGPWSGFRFGAEVSFDVGDREEGIRPWTFFLDVCALILEGECDRSALMMSTGEEQNRMDENDSSHQISDKSQRDQVDEYGRTFSPDLSGSIADCPLPNKDTPAPKSRALRGRTPTFVNLDCERRRTLTTRAAAKMKVAWLRAIAVPRRRGVSWVRGGREE